MATIKEALRRREIDNDLIQKIISLKLCISKLESMSIDTLRQQFNEKETVVIWEKISILHREKNRDNKTYLKLREFVQEDGKSLEEKREIYTSTDKCAELLSNLQSGENRILFFLGNGINEVRRFNPETESIEIEDNSLSTKYLALNFVSDMGDSMPRDFQDKIDALKKIHEVLSQEHTEYEMLDFMKHFYQMERLRDGFIEHIIKTCAKAEPNANHNSFLMLILLLRLINSNNKIVVFTTNYDNLLEKAYFGFNLHLFSRDMRHPAIREMFWLNDEKARDKLKKTSEIMEERILERRQREISRKDEKYIRYPKWSLKTELRPKYVLALEQIENNLIPIVPIHGSIRISKCPQCNRILETEATALGNKRCVYCGSEPLSIVLPTAEGDTDKELLKLLEGQIQQSNIVFFIGYGLDDPHITLKVNSGLENCPPKTIINICDKKLIKSKLKNEGHKSIEVNYYIDMSLDKISSKMFEHLGLSENLFRSRLCPTYRGDRYRNYPTIMM